jgi:hypothetical protein
MYDHAYRNAGGARSEDFVNALERAVRENPIGACD